MSSLYNNLLILLASMVELTNWIDVCPKDGNLLASCGEGECMGIKIYDRRESKFVKFVGRRTLGKRVALSLCYLKLCILKPCSRIALL